MTLHFILISVKISKCSGSCNNANDPYANLCVPDLSKDMNLKAFNLISRTYETRYIKWHDTCQCKCRLDTSVCNNKQRRNEDKYRCECRELIDKGMKDLSGIQKNCECECHKSCDIGEYLDYKHCKCR